MNRIREIRQAKNMTAQKLADLVGTTQSTIHRLETGERRLTDVWMNKIAKVLDVKPVDLMVISNDLNTFQEEVQLFTSEKNNENQDESNVLFQIKSSSLDRLGFRKNEVRSFSKKQEDLLTVKTGDVVIHSIKDDNRNGQEILVLRQFVAPCLLVANSTILNLPNIDTTKISTNFIAIQK